MGLLWLTGSLKRFWCWSSSLCGGWLLPSKKALSCTWLSCPGSPWPLEVSASSENKNDVLQNYMTFVSLSSHLFFLSNWGKKSKSIYSENTLNYKNLNVEILRLDVCRHILDVKKSTCTAAVYTELGRFPLHYQRKFSLIIYWHKFQQLYFINYKLRNC